MTGSPHISATPQKPRLWTRGFILLALIQTLDLFTYNMITPVIAKYATGLGFTLVMAGVVAGAFTFAALFARPASGALSDKLGRKRIVLTAVVVGCLAQVGYAFVTDYAGLIALRSVHGFFYALFGTAISAMALDSLPEERRAEGMGWFGTSYVLANALGPALGVALSTSLGFMPMFLIGAAVAAFTLLFGMMLPSDAAHQEKKTTEARNATAATGAAETGAAAATADPLEATCTPAAPGKGRLYDTVNAFVSIKCLPLAFVACCFIILWSYISTYIVMVGDVRGIVGISGIFITNSITLFFTRPFAGKLADKRGLSAVLYPAALFDALALVLIACSQQLWLFLVAGALKALGSGTITPSIQAKCGELETPDRSGVAMSTYLLGTDIGYAVGPIIGGAISASFGFEAMFLSGLPILALCVAVYVAWRRKCRA